jgi:hypothetical protein
MKKTLILLLLLTAAAGVSFAQAGGPGSDSRRNRGSGSRDAETTTITGKLELINGNIALKNGDTVFYITGLGRLIGFVDGLKEGAEVRLEGWVFAAPGNPETRGFLVSKLTINGKEYDNLLPEFGPMMGQGFGPMGGSGFGPGGDFKGHGCPGMGRDGNSRGRGGRRR